MMAVLLGMALGGLFATTLRAAVILILSSVLFQINFVISGFAQLFAVFVLTMTALYGLGALFASLFLLWGREAWQIVNAMVEPVYFISGFYFPVRTFGFVIALGASVLPLTLGLDAMRQLAFATGPALGFLPLSIEIAILFGLAVGFLTAAKFSLDVMERKAVVEGTLTDRRR
jgi:ABC-2 type transport system permease protein